MGSSPLRTEGRLQSVSYVKVVVTPSLVYVDREQSLSGPPSDFYSLRLDGGSLSHGPTIGLWTRLRPPPLLPWTGRAEVSMSTRKSTDFPTLE